MFRLSVLVLMLCGAASALPSWWGTRGLNRVVDARTEGAGKYSLGLFTFLGISGDERTAALPDGAMQVTDKEYNGTANLVAGLGLGRAAELGLRVTYVANQFKRSSDHQVLLDSEWEGDNGFSEAALSLKYNINPSAERIWFGIMPWAAIAIHDASSVTNLHGWDGIWEVDQGMYELRRPMNNSGSFSYGANLLVSYDLQPVVLHANIGYHHFSQTFEYTDARYDSAHQVVATENVVLDVADPVLYTAGGIEFPIGSTTFFAEIEWRHFLDRDSLNADGAEYRDIIQIAPGVRFNTDGLAIDVTGSFALSTFDPEWSDLGHSLFQADMSPSGSDRAMYAPFPGGYAPQFGLGVGLSYVGDFRKAPARISGRVYDSATNQNLDAAVSCSNDHVESVSTSDGQYRIEIPEGEAGLTASADGYLPMTKTVNAAEGGTYVIDFALERIQSTGTVTGTVTDEANGSPLTAGVASGGTQVQTSRDGIYSIEVPAGNRTLTASAGGYASESETVSVPAGGRAVQDFQLGLVVDFNNVYFDFDKDNIRTDARPVLDEIAGFLVSNPGISVRISGNADAIGTNAYNQDLAERSAAAVRDYLISKGVSEARLSTVSYGEEQPAAPNDTEANRALNRRAEFIILGR
jgi:outer membrane protein OmpA-like peptidoglycan-associated protein